MTEREPERVLTTHGQYVVRGAHSADRIHILAMYDNENYKAVGNKLLLQMVSSQKSHHKLLNKFNVPFMPEFLDEYSLNKIIATAWRQAEFLPLTNEPRTLESFGRAAINHYMAENKLARQLAPARMAVTDHSIPSNFAIALEELKQVTGRVDSRLREAQDLGETNSNTALQDSVKLQSEMSKGIAKLHEVIVEEVVPSWLKQAEEAGNSAAQTIRLTGLGLVITIAVSIVVAVMQIGVDHFSGEDASRQQEAIANLLKEQLSEEQNLHRELIAELAVQRNENNELANKLIEQVRKIPAPIVSVPAPIVHSNR